jgi:subtilisin family serine protease
MNKVSYALAMALVALSANAQSKLDAGSRLALNYYKHVHAGESSVVAPVSIPFQVNPASRAESTATMFVSLNPGADLSKIEALGFEVVTVAGNIALLNGSIDAVEQLAALDDVKSISFGSKVSAKLDKARASVNADEVQNGSEGLPQSYNGKGVIAGIFDTGLDPNHPNFNDANGNSRVKGLWMFSGNNGKYTYYSSDRISDFTTDTRAECHGTHTLGCMTGAFNKKGGKVAILSSNGNSVSVRSTVANPYYGIAPGCDIAISCGELYSANIAAGMAAIADYAEEQGQPFVINLSLGSNTGPHDGSDEYSQLASALAKRGIICIAAGNEGMYKLSYIKDFTADDSSFKTFPYSSSSSYSGKLDFWGDDATNFTVTAVVYDLTTAKAVYSYDISTSKEQDLYLTTSDYNQSNYIHDDYFDKAFTSSYLLIGTSHNTGTNNRREIHIEYNMKYNPTSNASQRYVFGVIVTGKDGHRVDVTNESDYTELVNLSQTGWVNGNADLSISSMACAEGLISVGSYNTRDRWPALSGGIYGYFNNDGTSATGYIDGELSGFSSSATLIDGTTRPTVVAPGSGIISSISSYYTDAQTDATRKGYSALYTKNSRDYYWESESGTSMACPVAAGTIALWLEADPTLTSEDVLRVIENSSVKDEVTATNTVKSGNGKINALAGIQYILSISGVKDITVDAAEKMLVTSSGQNEWQIYVPGASSVKAALYSTSGQLVAKASSNSETAVISGDKLSKGIYILNANGKSQRVIVK